MQDFINQAAVERAAANAFSGKHARLTLFAVLALGVAATAGVASATIWLGLALLIDEARKAFGAKLSIYSPTQARAGHVALDIAVNAALAVAPALAWYAQSGMGGAVAAVLVATLLINGAFSAQRGRMHAVIACAPYALLGLLFLTEAAGFAAAVACAIGLGYMFAATLYHVHAASHARMQDAEWVRQLNMSFGDAASAAWEIDFTRQRLAGAQRLSSLLGRAIGYSDVVNNAFFAPPAERALVNGVFAPTHGAVRRFALEHDMIGADGARIRVRHQGFVRTTPDGAPVRITCVTRRADVAVATTDLGIEALAATAIAAQSAALGTLRNELAAAFQDESASPTTASIADLISALVTQASAIERGVDDLAHTRHEADSANLAKSQFLANMSHELRTPLNAIIGYAEMLQEDAEDSGDATTVQDLNRILSAAKHLLSLINEILDLSKIEAGRMDVVAASFDTHDMLDELIETVRPIAEQNGNVIAILGDALQGDANTDAMKVRQCVLNLLSNAAKFTRNGRIEIEADRRTYNGVEQLFITVRDTGIGMSKEHMSRLFQPFVQADPSITQQYGGTGLGLTITRRLAQLLGGDVTVKSALGEGAAFTLHVPMDFKDASAALGAAAKIDDVQGAEDAPLVIVIEDEADARELAARALTRAGFAVQGVGGGEAGLALVRAKKPALVLLDIFLPDRSGWRVLQSLKQDPKTQDVPVVVLSVNEDRAHALALGAAEHIVKPADRDMLAATVMRFARNRPDAEATVSPAAAQKAAG